MQALSVLPLSSTLTSPNFDEVAELSAKMDQDMRAKLNIQDDKIQVQGTEEEHDEDEHEEEEEEFSFVCTNPDGSPVSADDVFDNGQIRPGFPIFDQDLLFEDGCDGSSTLRPPLRKLFIDDHSSLSSSASESDKLDEAPEGLYCEWSGKKAVETSRGKCNKSNSTGFSKLWRFRDLKLRSNSDGKDAFVFLNPSATTSTAKQSSSGAESEKAVTVNSKAEKSSSGEAKKVVVVKKEKAGKGKTTSSAHEKHYVMNRAKKESEKRKSYLPYRQDLVGFFANVNGLSRNVHPF